MDFRSLRPGRLGTVSAKHRRQILRDGFAVGQMHDRLVYGEGSDRSFQQRVSFLVFADHDYLRVRARQPGRRDAIGSGVNAELLCRSGKYPSE